jgi:hypothetical protein
MKVHAQLHVAKAVRALVLICHSNTPTDHLSTTMDHSCMDLHYTHPSRKNAPNHADLYECMSWKIRWWGKNHSFCFNAIYLAAKFTLILEASALK